MSRRLCMVVHGPYPIAEPRVERQALAAVRSGWDVSVVALRSSDEPRRERLDGVDVLRLPFRHVRGAGLTRIAWEYLGFAGGVALLFLLPRHRYEVVQVHNPPDFLVAPALVARRRGARLLLDVHDLSSDMFAMRFAGRPWGGVADRALRAIERWALRSSDSVITVHEPYRQELIRRGADPARTTVVMNSVDEAHLPKTTRSRPANFTIVYHGTVTPSYGLDLVLRAMAELTESHPDLRLEIFGDGDARTALKSLSADLGIAGRVRFSPGYLPHQAVLQKVGEAASLGVVPNRPNRLNRYALSSKLFEYVALGIPVVAAGLPTLRSHFGDDEVRFFEPGDIASLATAIAEIVSDPQSGRRFAAAAAIRYDGYRWPQQAERYISVLASLHRGGGSRP